MLLLVQVGALDYLHLGTPCGTFSIARTRPGGPPPLRSEHFPLGLPGVARELWWQLWSGIEFRARSLVLFEAVVRAGGNASLENPLSSLMWKVPWVQALVLDLHLFEVDMDQCEYGAPSMKPTRFLVSHALFKRWRRQCRGDHPHVPLKGFVRDARGRKVFATKLAQVYPDKLCQVVAGSVVQVVQGTLPLFTAWFQLQDQGPARKRALGSERSWKKHRQHQAALLAAAAGYQLKRGAAKPLLQIECEPGQAIQWSLQVVHPFTVPPQLHPQLMTNIKFMIAQPRELVQNRAHLL